MVKTYIKSNYSSILAMLVAATIAYYVLLADNHFFSIDSIIDFSQDLELPSHILVLGLIPIYISAILSVAAIFGIYLGRLLRSILKRF